MKKPTKQAMHTMLSDVRSIVPNRPLTYGYSIEFAHHQAARLRALAGATNTAEIDLLWLINQRAVPVNFVPSYKLGGHSGLTTDHITGRLEIFINDSEPRVRQRFSVLHELKHVLDWPYADVLHGKLGSGNEELQSKFIEQVANEFAAYVLMPTMLVKRVWFKTQSVQASAALFNVSLEAMTTRLEKLGLIGEPKPRPRMYFRTASIAIPGLTPGELCLSA